MSNQVAALEYLISVQRNKRAVDQTALKLSLEKPLLLDNPAITLSVFQIKKKHEQHLENARLARRTKRALRRPKLQPLKTKSLHEQAFQCWLEHYSNEDISSADKLATKFTLHGCKLTVVSCTKRKLGAKQTCGIVLRETKQVLHLSCENRVCTIPKQGTVFKCQDVEFERLV